MAHHRLPTQGWPLVAHFLRLGRRGRPPVDRALPSEAEPPIDLFASSRPAAPTPIRVDLAARRPVKASLVTLARQQLRVAQDAAPGLSFRHIFSEHADVVRHTVVALRAGQSLSASGPVCGTGCTVQVLQGSIQIRSGRLLVLCWPGELVAIPRQAQSLRARHDAVMLVIGGSESMAG